MKLIYTKFSNQNILPRRHLWMVERPGTSMTTKDKLEEARNKSKTASGRKKTFFFVDNQWHR